MASDAERVLADLRAEGDELDRMVADLPAADWARPTPADGWTIAHQVSHLAWTDRLAALAATDPAGFQAELRRALSDPAGYVDAGADEGAREEPAALLARWRAGRGRAYEAIAAVPPGTKLPWFGPPMSAASMATGRLMETWAHGLDVADALHVCREPTDRLWHVARMGVRARDHAFGVNGRPPPAEEFRVELTGPRWDTWAWGPEDAAQRVTGPALDFCLLATQRRHRADLALVAVGPDADAWLDIAQAFAGPPGAGRAPRDLGDAQDQVPQDFGDDVTSPHIERGNSTSSPAGGRETLRDASREAR
jgi:uncharacterized protein (TIGR03084 family)